MMMDQALLPVLGELNAALGGRQPSASAVHSSAFAPGSDLGPGLARLIDPSKADLAQLLGHYVATLPRGFQETLRGIVHYALTSDPQVLLTFAWAPAYDSELTIWEIVEPPPAQSGITILLKGRYPDEDTRFGSA